MRKSVLFIISDILLGKHSFISLSLKSSHELIQLITFQYTLFSPNVKKRTRL